MLSWCKAKPSQNAQPAKATTAPPATSEPLAPEFLHDPWVYRLAIGGIGLALIAFLITGGVIGATGHAGSMVKEYWAIGSALAGALVGVIAPSPRQKKEAAQDEREQMEGSGNAVKGGQVSAAAQKPTLTTRAASLYQPILLIAGSAVSLWFASELNEANAAVLRVLASGGAGGLLGLLVPSPGTHLKANPDAEPEGSREV